MSRLYIVTLLIYGLEETQAGIKIAGRNNNNLRYACVINIMAERVVKLHSFLMRVKRESEKAGLKLSIQKAKFIASSHRLTANRWGEKWKL